MGGTTAKVGVIQGGRPRLTREFYADRYVEGDDSVWEQQPVNGLAADGQLAFYRHRGFWMGMDTVRDRNLLEQLWNSGDAPWKVWS